MAGENQSRASFGDGRSIFLVFLEPPLASPTRTPTCCFRSTKWRVGHNLRGQTGDGFQNSIKLRVIMLADGGHFGVECSELGKLGNSGRVHELEVLMEL